MIWSNGVGEAPGLGPDWRGQGWRERRPGRSDSRGRDAFDDRIALLSRRLIERPAAGSYEDALHEALQALGLGLEAESVGFFALNDPPESLERRALWERHLAPSGSALERRDSFDVLDLRALPGGVATRLRAGESLWLSPRRRPGSGWRSAGTTWVVPCIGSKGLLGLFVIGVGVAPGERTRRCLGRADLVAALVAGFLERHQLARELETSRARQLHDERLETLGRLSSSVAHDLNNVLTAILGYSDLLGMELREGAAGRAELAEIQGAASRATELVDQVLCFGRRRPVGVKELDVGAAVKGLARMIERVLGDRVTLSLALAEGVPPVRVDPVRLEQVLLNLASNARDAIAQSGRGQGDFVLESRVVAIDDGGRDPSRPDGTGGTIGQPLAPGHCLRLSARDDGCGIDPSTRARIFEPFFTTKSEDAGTGLGLATAAEVLREVGGAIGVDSEPGVGSCLHLYLPLAVPLAAATFEPGAGAG